MTDGFRMTDGFLFGLAIGIVTAWFFYWRVVRFLAKVGFASQSVWRDLFSRTSYDGLMKMREVLDAEIARRSAP